MKKHFKHQIAIELINFYYPARENIEISKLNGYSKEKINVQFSYNYISKPSVKKYDVALLWKEEFSEKKWTERAKKSLLKKRIKAI